MLDYKKKYIKYKSKYLKIKGGELSQTKKKPYRVVFANPSWAIQQGLIKGSEEDMVKKCIGNISHDSSIVYDAIRRCWLNTLEILSNLKLPFDVLGLVEVGNMGSFKKTETHLKNIIKSYENNFQIQLGSIETATRDNPNSTLTLYISIIWNNNTLGNMLHSRTVNLILPEKKNKYSTDGRPFCMVMTDKCLLLCTHLGWYSDEIGKKKYEDRVSEELSLFIKECLVKNKTLTKNLLNTKKIIFTGDFNDASTLINKNNPFKVTIKLEGFQEVLEFHNNQSKQKLKKNLATCCWHEKGHQYRIEDKKTGKQIRDTGDYILWSNNNKNSSNRLLKKSDINIPKKNLQYKLENSSDHKYIIADIYI